MGTGIDFSTLSRAERIVLAGSGLLFANAFIPWWFRIRTPGRAYLHNAGLTGWSVAAALLALAAAVAVVVRASRFPRRGPADGTVYSIMGIAGLAALGVEATRGEAWIGLYVGMGFAALWVIGGLRRRTERRSGWV